VAGGGSSPPGLCLCMCVAVGLVAGGGSPPPGVRVHDYACCHLQADCLESGISCGPLRSIMSMGSWVPLPLPAGTQCKFQ